MTAAPQAQNDPADRPDVVARRAQVLAALSLAIDLGLGQPMEHMLRSTLLSMRLADQLNLDADDRATTYYASMVAWIGCHADSHELAGLFGDDLAFRADSYQVDWTGLPFARLLMSHLARGEPAPRRIIRRATFLATGRQTMDALIRSHCLSATTLADRLGLPAGVGVAIANAFERWDGRGLPTGAAKDQIPLPMRIVHLADVVEVHLRSGGPKAALDVARRRSGTQFDPAVVEVLCANATQLFAEFATPDAWQAAIDHAPDRDTVLTATTLDEILQAMGDFVDLKCAFTAGHSRGTAELAAQAGRCVGLPEPQVHELWRAGVVHDLGRMGVPNTIWEKSGTLTAAERERVRLHPYLTERILSRIPGLTAVAGLAGAHHERLDGSGYPRGDSGSRLGVQQRLLAAADTYHSLLEPRPHRPALTEVAAADRVRQEARAARLDAQAVDAVLTAAGHRTGRRRSWPAGLTTREVEVLRKVAQGASNRQIAQDLHISEKTTRNHVEHIYAKIGVSNRTGATLFAINHGLLCHFPNHNW